MKPTKKLQSIKQIKLLFVPTFFAIFVFFVISSPCWAATYYIDATSGNDNYSGFSPTAAWKTIAKVNSSDFQPGDYVLFKRGEIWREQLTIPSSGFNGNPIAFGAYGTGALPIITGFDVLTGFNALSHNAYQLTGVTTQPKVVAYNGTLLKYHNVGTDIGASEWDWDWATNILYINVGGDPSGATVKVGQRDFNITGVNKDFITIDGLTLKGANIASIFPNTGCDSWVIKNSTFLNTHVGIAGSSDVGNNHTIHDNTIHSLVEYGILWDNERSTDNIVQRNDIHDIGGKGGTLTNMQGIFMSTGSGTIIQNNTIHDVGDTAADHGIYMSGSNGVIVRYNNIYNILDGYGIKVSNSDNLDVYYNLIFTTGGGVIIEVGTPSYINVYNNVIANNAADDLHGIGLRASAGDHINWKNNIIYNMNYHDEWDTGTKYNLFIAAGVTNIVSDYNIAYSPTATSYYAFVGGVAKTWAEWQALGYDTHGLNVDPTFVNSSTDFYLQSTSPAINAGTNVGLTQDYYGNSVPQGSAPDIGAYEFQGLRTPKNFRIIK